MWRIETCRVGEWRIETCRVGVWRIEMCAIPCGEIITRDIADDAIARHNTWGYHMGAVWWLD